MAKQSKRLTDIITRHQVFLERLKTAEAVDFAKVFSKLDKATRQILSELDSDNLSNLSQTKLNKLLADLRAANYEQLNNATDDLYSNLETLAGYEAAFEVKTFQMVSAAVRLEAVDAKDAFADALARPITATGETLKGFIGDWTTGEVERLNNATRLAWSQGQTVSQLTRTIRGTAAAEYKDGILAISRRNAETITRTSLQHVSSSARAAVWEKNADVITGYRWVATLDSRTTQQCRSLDGQHFELGNGPMPPLHMGCRSTTVADVDPSLNFLDKDATRSSVDGYVPADQTYYDWLKDQSPGFQDEAIGPVRGQLFREGGLTADEFASLNLGRNFQPLTLAEMQKLEPLAFEKADIQLPDTNN